MRDRIPLRPGTSNPKMNLSWDTRMWTAAAVVKPDTRVSDRYTTMKPTCRRPMASCRKEGSHSEGSHSPYSEWHLTGTNNTWKIPTRKVIDEATITLCSFMSVMLRPGISSGTRRVTTAPIMRLSTGNDPVYKIGAKVWVKNITKTYHSILSLCDNLITFRAFLHRVGDLLWHKQILLPDGSVYIKTLCLGHACIQHLKIRKISLCFD